MLKLLYRKIGWVSPHRDSSQLCGGFLCGALCGSLPALLPFRFQELFFPQYLFVSNLFCIPLPTVYFWLVGKISPSLNMVSRWICFSRWIELKCLSLYDFKFKNLWNSQWAYHLLPDVVQEISVWSLPMVLGTEHLKRLSAILSDRGGGSLLLGVWS